jgi:hypothetical protein
MTKATIIERLLTQGHIAIACAGRILNKEAGYIQDLEDLHRDGNIDANESVILLRSGAYDLLDLDSEFEAMGETCRNGKNWDKCTCC